MENAAAEILLYLLAVGIIATVAGWLLHGAFGQGKFKALEAAKNQEIEELHGELETAAKARQDGAATLQKTAARVKELEGAVAAGTLQVTDAKAKHETEVGQLKQRLAALEPLQAAVAERDVRLENWNQRFEGLVREHDAALAAAGAEKDSLHGHVSGHRKALDTKEAELAALHAKLADIAAARDLLHDEHQKALEQVHAEKDAQVADLRYQLADAVAAKDAAAADHGKAVEALHAQLAEHQTTHETLHSGLAEKEGHIAGFRSRLADIEAEFAGHRTAVEATHAEKDSHIAGLAVRLAAADELHAAHSGRLEELTNLLGQRDEQLKSFDQRMRGATAEKDTIIGKLRSLVSQIEPLRQELQLRDQTIEQMQARIAAREASPELAEAQRHINSLLATNTSMKTALEGKDAELAAVIAKAAPPPQDNKLSAALSALADKEQALSSIQLELQDLRATHADLLKSKADQTEMINRQVVDVTGRHAAAQADLDDFAGRQAALEGRVRQLSSDHDAASRGIVAKQDELDQSRADLASLDSRTMTALDQFKARIAQLEKALDDELPRETAFRTEIEAKAAEITELRAQIADRDEQLARTGEVKAEPEAARSGLGLIGAAAAAGLGSLVSSALHAASSVLRGGTPAAPETSQPASGAQAPAESPADAAARLAMLQNQVVDVTGKHAAAKSELDDWSNRFSELEARSRQHAANYEAAARALEAKQAELDRARAEVADLDAKLVNIPKLEGDLADLRAQLVDRDEQLDAWDSRYHASVGELRGEIGDLTSKLHREPATASMAAAAGGGGSNTTAPAFSTQAPAARRADDARQLKELLAGISLAGVQFLPSSAELIPPALPILKQAADAIARFPDAVVEVAGHTDSWGMPQDNLELSQKRAGAVKEYLINSGIPAWRLVDTGYGHTRPIDSNDTADGRFANRRIEFHVK